MLEITDAKLFEMFGRAEAERQIWQQQAQDAETARRAWRRWLSINLDVSPDEAVRLAERIETGADVAELAVTLRPDA